MIRAAFLGFGVTIGLILIPVVHFVTALPSPFIGGLMAGMRIKALTNEAVFLGLLITLFMLGPIFLSGIVIMFLTSWDFTFVLIIILGSLPYILGLSVFGAIVGGILARR
jgi:hypothetical protein